VSFYNNHILPHVINLAMRNRELHPYRERVVSQAHGRVLEIGIGAGFNLPLYGPHVDAILGLDPSARLLKCSACSRLMASCCLSNMGRLLRKTFASGKIDLRRSGSGLAEVAT
jgi:hypothetical protein